MNKSFLSRVLVIVLLVVMSLSIVSCDKLPFLEDILGGAQGNTPDGGNETPECQHANVIDGMCFDCDSIIKTTIADLDMDKVLGTTHPNGTIFSQLCYVEATVMQVLNSTTGAMIIEDETGSIQVAALYSEDGESYDKMSEKPGAADKVLLHCILAKDGGEWYIKSANLVEFEDVEEPAKPIQTITIAEAMEICKVNSEETTERYYIRATITKVSNPTYGEMYIADETGEILVYNTKNSDGTVDYANMTERPVKGDEVLLYCTLNNHNGTNQVKSAWVVEFTHNEPEYDPSLYTEMTIAAAREAELGTKVKVSGVVAQITYANGYKPSGVILVDGTSSIYVYDGDLAGQVKVGNTVTLAGEKTYWVLESEAGNATKFGYEGACQIDSVTLISNDNGNSAFDKSWIEETTVKAIMDTPVTENITNKIFKATALVKKAPGNGFVNYYIDDLDGMTGSYVYTQCNGGDFSWLDEFDGKLCTVYFVAINAKSTATGCTWRFLPIEVINEGYTFNTDNAAEYAVKYHGVTQFLPSYTGDPKAELYAQISSELLGFEGATLSYSSSDEEVVYFTTNDNGVAILHCGKAGVANVTVTGSYNGKTYSETVVITVAANENIDYISVADAIATDKDTDVVVKGIVGPSLVNKVGFYLFGEDGSMIAVIVDSADVMSTISIGNEVVISGMRERYVKDDSYTTYGQDAIVSANVVANYYGEHAYSTDKAITGKTPTDINALNVTESHSTELYVMTVTIKVVETNYYSNIYISDGTTDLLLYCSSSSQYSWLKAYAGQTVTIEVAPCNWNEKTSYRGCVLAVVNEDGSKVYNTLNFN